MSNLSCKITSSLDFSEPFMVASSHWTDSEAALRQFVGLDPAAITLKTTSPSRGGEGKPGIQKRDKVILRDTRGEVFAYFTDGPKRQELLDIASTHALAIVAQKLLPRTALGLSVLQADPNMSRDDDHDYSRIASDLDLSWFKYVELNMKYSFRGIPMNEITDFLIAFNDDLSYFFDIFSEIPILIKFSREATRLFGLVDFSPVFDTIAANDGAAIIANSLRTRVPPSRSAPSNPRELVSGVVIGEHLYLETFDTIRMVRSQGHDFPIIASGGAVDIAGIVDLLSAGASAVQLCSVFDVYKPKTLGVLREQINALVGTSSLDSFVSEIRESENNWNKATKRALAYHESPVRGIERVFASDKHLGKLLGEILQNEFSEMPKVDSGVTCESELEFFSDFNLVVSLGNASTALLLSRIADVLGFSPIRLDSSWAFHNKLKDKNFKWDLAALPASRLEEIEAESSAISEDRRPYRLMKLATSAVELVGESTSLDEVRRVYHFGGATARGAMNELLRYTKLANQHKIDHTELLSLLKIWDQNDGILAKPPISRLYGLFTSKAELWKPLWHHTEPVWLVGSGAYMGKVPNGLKTVVDTIFAERRNALHNTDLAVRRLQMTGFVQYCRQLLNSKP